MRTTPREKLVLWLNGLIVAVALEWLLRSQTTLLTAQSMLLLLPILGIMAMMTFALLRRA
ncbi:hypothetical protein [Candidatus Viridilinea mediisalina]|uniref:Uncharacterized protein n=1 Tax=Candidatus Viridilinea mediisalina TaxID=2024553 RepID=A0A2A6RLN9_9CHLR|nr:hypothetical protein [Candidatus Viridilinea mediisalina]PDW03845.1 hypothetical protein CJ255_06740 [Candidatus Viridilinea mediisalina]